MDTEREERALQKLADAIRYEEELLVRIRAGKADATAFGRVMGDANNIADARASVRNAEAAVIAARGCLREDDAEYKIVRSFFRGGKLTIKRGLTLSEAQAYCRLPSTSSKTATGAKAERYTRALGPWFDGYEIDKD